MAAIRKAPENRRRPPARTSEEREMQMVGKAYDLAERQIEEGTASAQVITHFLKLGTQRERLERAKIEREVELLKARSESIESGKRIEELYTEAIAELRKYNGSASDDAYED